MKYYFHILSIIVFVSLGNNTFSQCGEDTPSFPVDLTGSPGGNWISPYVFRDDDCCGGGSNNKNCVEFVVTLDSLAEGILMDIYAGAAPGGSLFYSVDCGPPISIGTPLCLDGAGPHTVTFCKPGNNSNQYIISSIAIPFVTTSLAVNNGCSSDINTGNYIESSVVWNSVFPGAIGDWNYYLDCDAACDTVVATSLDTLYPPYIDYEVCGLPIGGCGTSICDTVRVEFSTNIDVVITPTTTLICPGDSGTIVNSSASGGFPPYTFQWSSGETSSTIFAGAGTYTIVIIDQSDCPPSSASVVINEITDTITATAGSDQIACLDATQIQLNGSFTGGTSSFWSGGTGVYAQSSVDPNAIYYPTAGEIAAGSVDLIITNSGIGICPADSDTMTINFVPFQGINTITVTSPTCFTAANGSATINTTLVTPPYSYTWNTVPIQGPGNSATNIPPGTYTVDAEDGNGCVTSEIFIVNPPVPLTAAYEQTNVSCFFGNDGSATVTPFGGTAPYTYSWSPVGGTDSTTNNLSAGTYTAIITDAVNCTDTVVIIITEPSFIASTITSFTNVSCFGASDGEATVLSSGGTPGYTYSWDPVIGGNAQTAIGLPAGPYTITVTDSNGCQGIANVTIDQPAIPLTNILTSTNVSCNAGADGEAIVTPNGGTTPYTYLWSNNDLDSIAGGLVANNYTVTITDSNGCITTNSILITEPSELVSDIVTSTNVSCFGFNDGEATVGTSGGSTPYTYFWNPGVTPTNSNLIAGTYTVVTTDSLGCIDTDVVIITEPALPLTTTTNQINNLCFGDNLGEASVTPNGGTAPYEYFWSLPSTNDTITNLPVGTYDITVTDTNGCIATNSVTITEPPVIVITAFGVDVICGTPSGEVHATVAGGTLPYTSTVWNPGGPSLDVFNLTAGIYTFYVTDAVGCVDSAIVSLSSLTGATASITSITHVSCYDGSDGSVTASVVGGAAPLTFLWSPSGGVGLTENGLAAGAYTFGVIDNNGCESFATAIVLEPDTLIAAIEGYDVTCNGGNDGSAVVSVSGGTGAGTYSYSWDNVAPTTDSVSTLLSEMQVVTVTDNNGCIVVDSVFIDQPTPLVLSITGTNVDCFNNSNGTASGVATGGVGNYTYSWNPVIGGTTADATGLPANTYTLTVTDGNSCIISDLITITEPPVTLSTTTVTIDVSCNGLLDGQAITTPIGGTAPYSYFWSNADTDSIAGNLSVADTLSVIITDANGCITNDLITIGEPPVLTTNIVNAINTFCEQANGGATATATGGTQPYSYLWDNLNTDTTANVDSLLQGAYSVIITDSNGCTNTELVTIGNTPSPQVSIISQTNVSCNGGFDGTAVASGSLGTGTYDFMWYTSGVAQDTATGLFAGQHTVILTDGNGCKDTATIFISEPPQLIISVDTIINVLCSGDSNGSAIVSTTGGTGAYSYSWDNGDSTSTASNLALGPYVVTVTDALSCSVSLNLLVSQPALLTSSISGFADELCVDSYDGSATVSVVGGTPAYTYLWDDANSQTTAIADSLAPGSYSVMVQDSNGCTSSSSVTIGTPTPVITSVMPDDTICEGNSITLTASGSGGAGNYQYYWNNGVGLANPAAVNPSAGTDYEVTAIDQFGCQGNTVSVSIVVYSMSQNDVGVYAKTPICHGTNTLLYAFLNSSTTGPVTYSWSPTLGDSAGVYILFQTVPTTYVATITNSCGVVISDSVFVDFKPLPTLAFSLDTNIGCQPFVVSFTDQSSSNSVGDVINTWEWDFGDGGTSILENPVYVYDSAGVFIVNLNVTSSAGCFNNDTTLNDTVTVWPKPTADFETGGLSNSSFNMETTFTNLSQDAVSYSWNFGDGGTSTTTNPIHTYQTEGDYLVSLISTSSDGCIDTTIYLHTIITEFTLYVPNTFTPDGDGVNDTFFSYGHGIDEDTFQLWIYDRWGEIVFLTYDYNDQWHGDSKNGEPAIDDTYIWVIKTKDTEGQAQELQGHVNLIR